MSRSNSKGKIGNVSMDHLRPELVELFSRVFASECDKIAIRCEERIKALAKKAGGSMDEWSYAIEQLADQTRTFEKQRSAFIRLAEKEFYTFSDDLARERKRATVEFRKMYARAMVAAAKKIKSEGE